MDLMTGANFLATTLLFVCLVTLNMRIWKIQRHHTELIGSLHAAPAAGAPTSPKLTPLDNGPQPGDSMPEFPATLVDSHEAITYRPLSGRETVIFITAVGCGVCEASLRRMALYDLSSLDLDIVVINFVPPEGNYDLEGLLHKHMDAVQRIQGIETYMMDVAALNQIRLTGFPAFIRVSSEGQVLSSHIGTPDVLQELLYLAGHEEQYRKDYERMPA